MPKHKPIQAPSPDPGSSESSQRTVTAKESKGSVFMRLGGKASSGTKFGSLPRVKKTIVNPLRSKDRKETIYCPQFKAVGGCANGDACPYKHVFVGSKGVSSKSGDRSKDRDDHSKPLRSAAVAVSSRTVEKIKQEPKDEQEEKPKKEERVALQRKREKLEKQLAQIEGSKEETGVKRKRSGSTRQDKSSSSESSSEDDDGQEDDDDDGDESSTTSDASSSDGEAKGVQTKKKKQSPKSLVAAALLGDSHMALKLKPSRQQRHAESRRQRSGSSKRGSTSAAPQRGHDHPRSSEQGYPERRKKSGDVVTTDRDQIRQVIRSLVDQRNEIVNNSATEPRSMIPVSPPTKRRSRDKDLTSPSDADRLKVRSPAPQEDEQKDRGDRSRSRQRKSDTAKWNTSREGRHDQPTDTQSRRHQPDRSSDASRDVPGGDGRRGSGEQSGRSNYPRRYDDAQSGRGGGQERGNAPNDDRFLKDQTRNREMDGGRRRPEQWQRRSRSPIGGGGAFGNRSQYQRGRDGATDARSRDQDRSRDRAGDGGGGSRRGDDDRSRRGNDWRSGNRNDDRNITTGFARDWDINRRDVEPRPDDKLRRSPLASSASRRRSQSPRVDAKEASVRGRQREASGGWDDGVQRDKGQQQRTRRPSPSPPPRRGDSSETERMNEKKLVQGVKDIRASMINESRYNEEDGYDPDEETAKKRSSDVDETNQDATLREDEKSNSRRSRIKVKQELDSEATTEKPAWSDEEDAAAETTRRSAEPDRSEASKSRPLRVKQEPGISSEDDRALRAGDRRNKHRADPDKSGADAIRHSKYKADSTADDSSQQSSKQSGPSHHRSSDRHRRTDNHVDRAGPAPIIKLPPRPLASPFPKHAVAPPVQQPAPAPAATETTESSGSESDNDSGEQREVSPRGEVALNSPERAIMNEFEKLLEARPILGESRYSLTEKENKEVSAEETKARKSRSRDKSRHKRAKVDDDGRSRSGAQQERSSSGARKGRGKKPWSKEESGSGADEENPDDLVEDARRAVERQRSSVENDTKRKQQQEEEDRRNESTTEHRRRSRDHGHSNDRDRATAEDDGPKRRGRSTSTSREQHGYQDRKRGYKERSPHRGEHRDDNMDQSLGGSFSRDESARGRGGAWDRHWGSGVNKNEAMIATDNRTSRRSPGSSADRYRRFDGNRSRDDHDQQLPRFRDVHPSRSRPEWGLQGDGRKDQPFGRGYDRGYQQHPPSDRRQRSSQSPSADRPAHGGTMRDLSNNRRYGDNNFATRNDDRRGGFNRQFSRDQWRPNAADGGGGRNDGRRPFDDVRSGEQKPNGGGERQPFGDNRRFESGGEPRQWDRRRSASPTNRRDGVQLTMNRDDKPRSRQWGSVRDDRDGGGSNDVADRERAGDDRQPEKLPSNRGGGGSRWSEDEEGEGVTAAPSAAVRVHRGSGRSSAADVAPSGLQREEPDSVDTPKERGGRTSELGNREDRENEEKASETRRSGSRRGGSADRGSRRNSERRRPAESKPDGGSGTMSSNSNASQAPTPLMALQIPPPTGGEAAMDIKPPVGLFHDEFAAMKTESRQSDRDRLSGRAAAAESLQSPRSQDGHDGSLQQRPSRPFPSGVRVKEEPTESARRSRSRSSATRENEPRSTDRPRSRSRDTEKSTEQRREHWRRSDDLATKQSQRFDDRSPHDVRPEEQRQQYRPFRANRQDILRDQDNMGPGFHGTDRGGRFPPHQQGGPHNMQMSRDAEFDRNRGFNRGRDRQDSSQISYVPQPPTIRQHPRQYQQPATQLQFQPVPMQQQQQLVMQQQQQQLLLQQQQPLGIQQQYQPPAQHEFQPPVHHHRQFPVSQQYPIQEQCPSQPQYPMPQQHLLCPQYSTPRQSPQTPQPQVPQPTQESYGQFIYPGPALQQQCAPQQQNAPPTSSNVGPGSIRTSSHVLRHVQMDPEGGILVRIDGSSGDIGNDEELSTDIYPRQWYQYLDLSTIMDPQHPHLQAYPAGGEDACRAWQVKPGEQQMIRRPVIAHSGYDYRAGTTGEYALRLDVYFSQMTTAVQPENPYTMSKNMKKCLRFMVYARPDEYVFATLEHLLVRIRQREPELRALIRQRSHRNISPEDYDYLLFYLASELKLEAANSIRCAFEQYHNPAKVVMLLVGLGRFYKHAADRTRKGNPRDRPEYQRLLQHMDAQVPESENWMVMKVARAYATIVITVDTQSRQQALQDLAAGLNQLQNYYDNLKGLIVSSITNARHQVLDNDPRQGK